MSEHSVEYLVVPHLKTLLEPDYKAVIPLYFWNSREGNTYSKYSQQLRGKLFKILAVYPRRPKVVSYYSETIFIKFNHQLFERANFNAECGFDTIAGLPLIGDIYDISLNPSIVYFNLFNNGGEEILELSLTNDLSITSKNVALIDQAQIKQIIEGCKSMSWNNAVFVISESKYFLTPHSLFGDMYKPVYYFIEV